MARMDEPTPQKKPATDWEAVQVAYRIGVLSLRAIAAEHNCTEGAIRKRAKTHDWPRDLSAKVKAKAEELVRKAEVRSEVRTTGLELKATEREQVEISAQIQANILIDHRTDIRRGRTLFGALLAEVETQTGDPGLFEQLGELLDDTKKTADGRVIQDKLNEIYRKVISTPGRVDSARKLVEMLERVVKLERQAFNMDAQQTPESPLDALIKAVSGTTLPIVQEIPGDD